MEAARLERGAVAVERAKAANYSMVDEQGGGAAPARAKGAADGAAFGAARRGEATRLAGELAAAERPLSPSAKAENAPPAPGCARACWTLARPTWTCWRCWRRSPPTTRAMRRSGRRAAAAAAPCSEGKKRSGLHRAEVVCSFTSHLCGPAPAPGWSPRGQGCTCARRRTTHGGGGHAFVSQTRRATGFALSCSAAVVCVVCRSVERRVGRGAFL